MDATPTGLHVVVSDLHLGEGGPLEDFLDDAAFCAFLADVGERGRAWGAPAEIVLAGDAIDFLQVAPLRHGPWREAEAKLRRVAAAHRGVFDALGRFVSAGHRLIVLPGNHDVELAFYEIQAAFRALVAGGDAAAAARVVFPNETPLGGHYPGCARGPFAYRLPGVYIEHGHQLDPESCFDFGGFFEDAAGERIRLPFQSRAVLDLWNEVEPRAPFLDKLRPRSAALLLLWLIDPALARERLPALAGLGRRLYPELRRLARTGRGGALAGAKGSGGTGVRGASAPDALFPAVPIDPRAQEEEVLAWLGSYADELQILDEGRAVLYADGHDGSKGPGQPSERVWAAYAAIFEAALEAMASLRAAPAGEDGATRRALALARAEGAEVIVLGHDHRARDVRTPGARYLGTGAWTAVLELDHDDLRRAGTSAYRALLAYLRARTASELPKRLSFVEIAYSSGRLEAQLCELRNGRAPP
jgi:UDP-2,3-diacylglucosamine pyrophosphatase LpxH